MTWLAKKKAGARQLHEVHQTPEAAARAVDRFLLSLGEPCINFQPECSKGPRGSPAASCQVSSLSRALPMRVCHVGHAARQQVQHRAIRTLNP